MSTTTAGGDVFTLYRAVTHEYTVEAWIDTFHGWRHEFTAKFAAGISDLTSEALEGAALIEAAADGRRTGADAPGCARFPRTSARARTSRSTRWPTPGNWKS